MLACAVGFAAGAHAQTVPNAGSVLDANRDRAAPVQRDPGQLLPADTASPVFQPPSTGIKVTPTSFTFSGNHAFSNQELAAVVSEFVGRELDFAGLTEATNRVRAFYRRNGYFLAAAYLPKQTIESGVINIAVVEGRIGKITVDTSKHPDLNGEFATNLVNNVMANRTELTEANLERGLLLLNDLDSVSVRSTIRPGDAEGVADVLIDVDKSGKKFSGSADFDNDGQCGTGKNRIGAGVAAANLTGYGDTLTFRGNLADASGNGIYRLGWTVPVGYSGTKLSLSHVGLRYRVHNDCAPGVEQLNIKGSASVETASLAYPVIRSRNANLFVQGGVDYKRFNDEDISQTREQNSTSLKVGVFGDWRDGIGGGSLNAGSLTLSKGRAKIDSQVALAVDQGQGGDRSSGDFAKVNWSFQRVQRLSDQLSLLLSTIGQAANHNLISGEKFSLGGAFGVRAYPSGYGAADSAQIGTVELRHLNKDWRIGNADLLLLAFFDVGHATLRHNPQAGQLNSVSVKGAGIGVGLQLPDSYTARLTLAQRVGSAPAIVQYGSDANKSRAWFSISKFF